MITIQLPWPDKSISPNARERWGKIGAVTVARNEAYALALQQLAGQDPLPTRATSVRIDVLFRPPNKRQRDLDNLIAMCKSYQDGIFLAIGSNDSIIREANYRIGTPATDGQVWFMIQDLHYGV